MTFRSNTIFGAGIAICIVLFSTNFVSAQSPSDEKYKLAQSYESSGDFRNAARLFQELYAGNKSEKNFDGVARTLSALGQFSALAPLIEERLAFAPSAKLFALYGAALWRSGKTAEADKAWQTGLVAAGNDDTKITAIAATQAGLRLYDKAVGTYMLAREKSGNSLLYADELAGLYAATGNFERGADEVLTVFAAQKNMAMAQGRLAALMAKPEANSFIAKKLKSLAGSGEYLEMKLYLWFLRETKDYDNALDMAEKVDRASNIVGRELYDFAEGTKRDGSYPIALKAYSRIIGIGKSSSYYSQALYGYARTLELNLSKVTTMKADDAEEILDRYEDIIKNFPNTPVAAECQYRRGVIALEYLHDDARAKTEFSTTVTKFGIFPPAASALTALGTIAMSEGDTLRAVSVFTQVINRYATISPDDADKARFYAAEMQYYAGKPDSAKEIYAILAAKSDKDIANDALSRIVFLEQNKENLARLNEFARAESLAMQKKTDAALAGFRALQNAEDDIAERAYVSAAGLAFSAGNIASAQAMGEEYLQKFPEAIYGDKAMLLLAQMYDAAGAKDKAINILTELLARYPRSIYLQEAREKVRKLRGDA